MKPGDATVRVEVGTRTTERTFHVADPSEAVAASLRSSPDSVALDRLLLTSGSTWRLMTFATLRDGRLAYAPATSVEVVPEGLVLRPTSSPRASAPVLNLAGNVPGSGTVRMRIGEALTEIPIEVLAE